MSKPISLLLLGLGGALMAGWTAPLRAQAPPETPRGWQASGQLLQGYDSNIFLTLAQPQADSTTQVRLSLARHWGGPHWSFTAAYTPQGFAYAAHSRLDYLAHAYQQDWIYGLGPHTQLHWTVNAERYPERGASPQIGDGLAAVAVASQVLALETVLTGAQTSLTLSHQSSPRSTWTAGGVGALQAFRPDTALLNQASPSFSESALRAQSRSGGGNVAWSYELRPERTLQLSALDNEMWFTNPYQRLRFADALVSIQQQLGGSVTLQLGAGPSWTWVLRNANGATAGNLPGQSYAANASLTKHQGHGQYGLTWQHADQMGLVPGGVTTDLLAVQYQWQSGHWSAAVSAGRSSFAGAGGGSAAQNSLYAAGQLSYQVGAECWLRVSSSLNAQAVPLGFGTTGNLRRSQVSLGIVYQPWGAH